MDENEDIFNTKHTDPRLKEGALGYAPAPLSLLGRNKDMFYTNRMGPLKKEGALGFAPAALSCPQMKTSFFFFGKRDIINQVLELKRITKGS